MTNCMECTYLGEGDNMQKSMSLVIVCYNSSYANLSDEYSQVEEVILCYKTHWLLSFIWEWSE